MESINFTKLDSSEQDNGQRIEVDVQVDSKDVDSVISEFFTLMAKARGITETDESAIRSKLEDMISAQVVKEALQDFVLNRFTMAAVKELKADFVLTPGVHAEEFPEHGSDFSFSINLTCRPKLSLSSIDPVKVTIDEVNVEEADIQGQLDYTAQQFASLVRADHQILQEGDIALMDVDLLEDGKVNKDLSGVRRPVEVKRGLLPDAFIDGVLGMEPPEMRKFEFILPGVDGDVQYKADVTLWEVQERKVPVIDDEWVAKNLPQFTDLNGFRAYIKADLSEQKDRVEKQEAIYQARAALAERLEGTIPDEMYMEAKDSLVRQTSQKLADEGSSLDEYMQEHGIDKEVFNMNVFMQASDVLRQNLALDILARERGLEATEEDIARAKQALPGPLATLSLEALDERGMLNPLKERIRRDKAQQWLLETAEIVKA